MITLVLGVCDDCGREGDCVEREERLLCLPCAGVEDGGEVKLFMELTRQLMDMAVRLSDGECAQLRGVALSLERCAGEIVNAGWRWRAEHSHDAA